MRQPHRFPAVLTGVMIFLMCTSAALPLYSFFKPLTCSDFLVLFGGAGALSYLTFGKDVQSLVITNLDTNNKMVQAVRPHSLCSHPILQLCFRCSSFILSPSCSPCRCSSSQLCVSWSTDCLVHRVPANVTPASSG
jgi:hypothetical protein